MSDSNQVVTLLLRWLPSRQHAAPVAAGHDVLSAGLEDSAAVWYCGSQGRVCNVEDARQVPRDFAAMLFES